jgi:hypothetical protein
MISSREGKATGWNGGLAPLDLSIFRQELGIEHPPHGAHRGAPRRPSATPQGESSQGSEHQPPRDPTLLAEEGSLDG